MTQASCEEPLNPTPSPTHMRHVSYITRLLDAASLEEVQDILVKLLQHGQILARRLRIKPSHTKKDVIQYANNKGTYGIYPHLEASPTVELRFRARASSRIFGFLLPLKGLRSHRTESTELKPQLLQRMRDAAETS